MARRIGNATITRGPDFAEYGIYHVEFEDRPGLILEIFRDTQGTRPWVWANDPTFRQDPYSPVGGGRFLGFDLTEAIERLEERVRQRGNPFEQPEPPDAEYDPHELREGTKVEMEHTNDRRIAKRIAKDHLDEDPEYYVKLATLGLNPDIRSNPDKITITMKPRKGQGYRFQAGSFAEFSRLGRGVFKAAFTAEQKRDPFIVEADGNYVGHIYGPVVFRDPAIWDDILRIASGG